MSIKTPKSREEFEHNLHLMEERALRVVRSENESAMQNFSSATWPHLKKVKRLPNARINLLTINEMIRLQANMENNDSFR
ncbi:hypothetical protein [Flavobacterium sp. PL02]|uniref:hypothetical protein n=1 Tax=Flavobacterium sp. PL02 TaxID=3088354 RepID=UPI002B2271F6|nr:hypothetical protein [Flavobacterium sp. PL02]MEA9414345.1 hypothetical protein [Flavobacterium sp. PL02]